MQGVVITARIGSPNFRPRAPRVVNPRWRYVFFTDKQRAPTPPWEFKLVTKETLDTCRDAKRFKMFPHNFVRGDYHLWIDSHCVLKCDPQEIVGREPLTLVRHWCKLQCIREEAKRITSRRKADPAMVERQLHSYRAHPNRWGLWYGGFIGGHNTPEVQQFRKVWYDLTAAGTARDQLSLPVALRQTEIKFRDIPREDRGRLFEITKNG